MFRTYRIGRILGFPLEVNLSFLLMLAAVALFLGGAAGVFVVLVAFASVIVHELGHALVARHLGVPIAGIELHFFGGAAKMAGQPRSAGDEVAIAAAGPAVSFALGGISMILYSLTGLGIFQLLTWVNVILGGFNLIPALPMDGGRIFRALMSQRMGFARATDLAVKIARGVAIAFGAIGILTLHLHLVLLAVVLWAMSSAERQLAHAGYGAGHGSPGGWSRSNRAHRQPEVEVLPGFDRRDDTGPVRMHRPVQSGGFVIRRVNGRWVIEPVGSR